MPRRVEAVANRVHTHLCGASGACNAQILLVMPETARMKTLSHAELKAELQTALQDKIDFALANNREFEIQLVQNINTNGNFDQKQQALVRKFGAAAYEAIGEVRRNLIERKGLTVYTDATAGSNGTVMLTENVSSWSGYLQAIDLVDGRAGMHETIDAIDAVTALTGRNNVRIFTTNGDHLAADRPTAYALRVPLKMLDVVTDVLAVAPPLSGLKDRLGWKPKIAIANAHVTAEILRRRPATEAFMTTRLDMTGVPWYKRLRIGSKQVPGPGHVASMNGKLLAARKLRGGTNHPEQEIRLLQVDGHHRQLRSAARQGPLRHLVAVRGHRTAAYTAPGARADAGTGQSRRPY